MFSDQPQYLFADMKIAFIDQKIENNKCRISYLMSQCDSIYQSRSVLPAGPRFALQGHKDTMHFVEIQTAKYDLRWPFVFREV